MRIFLFSGPKHSCMMDEECTHGASCVENKVAANRNAAPKICKCNEGFAESGAYCSGELIFNLNLHFYPCSYKYK